MTNRKKVILNYQIYKFNPKICKFSANSRLIFRKTKRKLLLAMFQKWMIIIA